MPSASWIWRLPLRFDIIVSLFTLKFSTDTHTHTQTPTHTMAEINLWHMSLIYGARSYFGCQSGSAAVNKDWQPACGQGSGLGHRFFGSPVFSVFFFHFAVF